MPLKRPLFLGIATLILFFLSSCGNSPPAGNNLSFNPETNNENSVSDPGTPDGTPEESYQFVPKPYDQPAEWNFYGEVNQEDFSSPHFFLPSKFFPIGWSASGNFAYAVEPADEACGCYFLDFYVQNMDSDKLLYEFRYNSDQGPEGEKLGEDFPTVWKNKYSDLEAAFHQHEIVQQREWKPFLGKQFSYGGHTFKIDLQTASEKLEENWFNALTKIEVWVEDDAGRRKRVYRDPEKEFFAILEAEIYGAFASPYEARVAILLKETLRGWEGPPNVVRPRLIGCDLDDGF